MKGAVWKCFYLRCFFYPTPCDIQWVILSRLFWNEGEGKFYSVTVLHRRVFVCLFVRVCVCVCRDGGIHNCPLFHPLLSRCPGGSQNTTGKSRHLQSMRDGPSCRQTNRNLAITSYNVFKMLLPVIRKSPSSVAIWDSFSLFAADRKRSLSHRTVPAPGVSVSSTSDRSTDSVLSLFTAGV